MIEKSGTCSHCGFEKRNCMCGRRKNTSGDYVMYSNYTDLRGASDYATTSRISRTSSSDIKLMEELLPVNGELLTNYLKRTEIAETKLVEHSIYQHLFGTKQTWACHTSSRYCFICTLSQYVGVHKALWQSLSDVIDITDLKISIDDNTIPPKLSLYR